MSTPAPDYATTTPAEGVTIHHGDCLDVLRAMPAESVHAIVTDPPYGLGFMGREWDALPPGREWAAECLRVLKPGGHLLAFGGTRTWHRLAVAVEDAGFEVRDSLAWLYGSGFPKSMDVSKAIDKAAGAERAASGERGSTQCSYLDRGEQCPGHDDAGQSMSGATVHRLPTAAATPEAKQWEGWGTALKPAFEPIVMARKPIPSTVAANVLEHGTGALNIDACRIGTDEVLSYSSSTAKGATSFGTGTTTQNPAGRWPANVVLDESQAAELDRQSGNVKSGGNSKKHKRTSPNWGGYSGGSGIVSGAEQPPSEGGASRFFYVAKAGRRERPEVDGVKHPTVKPLALMRHLCRLVTPPGGVILEPFAGSGTTVEAAMLEGFDVVGIEREAEYLPLIEARVQRALEARAREADAAEVRLF